MTNHVMLIFFLLNCNNKMKLTFAYCLFVKKKIKKNCCIYSGYIYLVLYNPAIYRHKCACSFSRFGIYSENLKHKKET